MTPGTLPPLPAKPKARPDGATPRKVTKRRRGPLHPSLTNGCSAKCMRVFHSWTYRKSVMVEPPELPRKEGAHDAGKAFGVQAMRN